mmetsp:Transcript_9921/g.25607  ORF Transcript_9921/g.25607 Transcript_9921/m.25607 type:complete len:200 (-) Transcript_9921:579-1178(-)
MFASRALRGAAIRLIADRINRSCIIILSHPILMSVYPCHEPTTTAIAAERRGTGSGQMTLVCSRPGHCILPLLALIVRPPAVLGEGRRRSLTRLREDLLADRLDELVGSGGAGRLLAKIALALRLADVDLGADVARRRSEAWRTRARLSRIQLRPNRLLQSVGGGSGRVLARLDLGACGGAEDPSRRAGDNRLVLLAHR